MLIQKTNTTFIKKHKDLVQRSLSANIIKILNKCIKLSLKFITSFSHCF